MAKTATPKKPTKAEEERMLRDYLAQILVAIAPGCEPMDRAIDIASQIDNATTIIPKLNKKLATFDLVISDLTEDKMDLKAEINELNGSNHIFPYTSYGDELDVLAICDSAIGNLLPLDEDDEKIIYGSVASGNRAARYRIIEFLTAKYASALRNR